MISSSIFVFIQNSAEALSFSEASGSSRDTSLGKKPQPRAAVPHVQWKTSCAWKIFGGGCATCAWVPHCMGTPTGARCAMENLACVHGMVQILNHQSVWVF